MTTAVKYIDSPVIIEHFKSFYRDLMSPSFVKLEDIYDNDLIFIDPIHQINGLAEVANYTDTLCDNLTECRFEYLDEMISYNSAYIKWNMHYRHPKLGDKLHTLRGVSHICFDKKITYHEDCYDVGAMVYEHLPIIGALTRMVKSRLTA